MATVKSFDLDISNPNISHVRVFSLRFACALALCHVVNFPFSPLVILGSCFPFPFSILAVTPSNKMSSRNSHMHVPPHAKVLVSLPNCCHTRAKDTRRRLFAPLGALTKRLSFRLYSPPPTARTLTLLPKQQAEAPGGGDPSR